MKKNILLAFVVVASIVGITSCKKDFDPGATKVSKLAGEWFVTLQDETGKPLTALSTIATYNTAADNDSLYIDDEENLYGFKIKALTNTSNLTFATTGSSNDYYDPANPDDYPKTAIVTDGKVLPNAGKSKTGIKTDSIYFKVKFSDDPTTTYIVAGTARTNWAEDAP